MAGEKKKGHPFLFEDIPEKKKTTSKAPTSGIPCRVPWKLAPERLLSGALTPHPSPISFLKKKRAFAAPGSAGITGLGHPALVSGLWQGGRQTAGEKQSNGNQRRCGDKGGPAGAGRGAGSG